MQFQSINSVFTLTVTATQTENKWPQNPIGVVSVSVVWTLPHNSILAIFYRKLYRSLRRTVSTRQHFIWIARSYPFGGLQLIFLQVQFSLKFRQRFLQRFHMISLLVPSFFKLKYRRQIRVSSQWRQPDNQKWIKSEYIFLVLQTLCCLFGYFNVSK